MALRSRRAADAFAAALENPAASVSADDQRLVQVARDLQAIEWPVMSVAVAADVRARLLHEFPDTVPVREHPVGDRPDHPPDHARPNRTRPDRDRRARPARRRVRRPALASIGAVAAVVIGTATAVGAISQQALPGDALYPVKRGIERVQVDTARGDHSRGEHLLSQAGTRLAEVQAMSITRGDGVETSRLVDDTLNTFRDQARQGATSLISDYGTNHDAASIRDVRSFTATSVTHLATIANRLAPSTEHSVLQTVRILQSIDDSASTTCPSCSPRPALRIPRSLQAVLSAAGARGPGADSPSNGPAAKAQRPGGRPGPGRAGTGSPAGPANPTPTSPRRSGGAGGGTQPSGGGGQPSPTTVPSQPLPSQPLPSEPLPSQPLPTLPSPSLPLPSKPLPSLPLQVPSAPAAGGGHGSHGIPVPLPPVQLP